MKPLVWSPGRRRHLRDSLGMASLTCTYQKALQVSLSLSEIPRTRTPRTRAPITFPRAWQSPMALSSQSQGASHSPEHEHRTGRH